jgi:hypothetical protein
MYYSNSIIRFLFFKRLFGVKAVVLSFLCILLINHHTSAQGNSLLFNGVDQYVESAANIPVSGDFTVSVWAQHDASQTGGFIEILSQGTTGNAFYIGRDTGGKIRVGDSWASTTISFPTDNLWHQFTVTKTATNTCLYLDGSLVATPGTAIANPVASEFRIARQYGVHEEYFKGSIDEISIWNRSLTAPEIATLLNKPLLGNETGLVHYYNFDQSSGTNLPDLTGANHGTLYNSPAWVTSTALTVGDLQATGSTIKWYDAPSGGNLLASTTLLVNGTTYYASQTVNGVESTDRLAVTANLVTQVAPTTGTHTPAQTQVVWNWNAASGASGYRWSATNNYATAEVLGNVLTKTETSLSCNTAYTRYVWAYNASGCVSAVTTLTQPTSACAAASTTFDFTGAMQTFTVPAGVTSVTIEAWGAEGGTSTAQSGGTTYAGGKGAYTKGSFLVTQGQVISLLVAGKGSNGTCGAGGGGGSFAVKSGTLLIAAGGGGGGFHCTHYGGAIGGNGLTSNSGGNGIQATGAGNTPQVGFAGGINGNGGAAYYGGGGGGWLSGGTTNYTGGGGSYPGAGGAPGGGYGGGGGYYDGCCGGSGGGGGYSGGSGGTADGCAGGGGGSYNGGTNPASTAGSRSGNGQIKITY